MLKRTWKLHTKVNLFILFIDSKFVQNNFTN